LATGNFAEVVLNSKQTIGGNLDITKILEDLRQERDQLEEAILSLERLAAGGRRRGRPPAWIAAVRQQTAAVKPTVTKGKKPRRKGPAAEGEEND
jgi:hypothetical protein